MALKRQLRWSLLTAYHPLHFTIYLGLLPLPLALRLDSERSLNLVFHPLYLRNGVGQLDRIPRAFALDHSYQTSAQAEVGGYQGLHARHCATTALDLAMNLSTGPHNHNPR